MAFEPIHADGEEEGVSMIAPKQSTATALRNAWMELTCLAWRNIPLIRSMS